MKKTVISLLLLALATAATAQVTYDKEGRKLVSVDSTYTDTLFTIPRQVNEIHYLAFTHNRTVTHLAVGGGQPPL